MDRYVRINKIVLTLLGHWPYHTPMQNKIIRTVTFAIAFGLLPPILVDLYNVRNYFDELVIRMPMTATAIIYYFHFGFLVIKSPMILVLLNHISQDFEELQSFETEFEILQKSSEDGRSAVFIYTFYTSFSTVLYCSLALAPQILDIISPLNATRSKNYVAEVDYVIFDKESHYKFIFCHSFIAGCLAIGTIVACDIMLYSFIQHACGMFRVLWYRLEKVFLMDDIYNEKSNMEKDETYDNVVAYAKLHIRLLEYTQGVDSCYSTFLLCSIVVTVVIMTFQGAMIIIKIDEPEFVVRYGTYYLAQFIHILYFCIPGQSLVDHSTYMIDCLYDTRWYDMSPKIQKLILFTMMRSLKESKVTIGKMVNLSMETCSLIVKTVFTYLSVFISMRK